ncbi:hypothetical protein AUR64_16910 [Haloprofundus marisrubri]|uniref:Uncharacterized protein n=2 Tax=Haloprofundus marisrubri TaxID=1514971 RepID=A0A0W1R815_9EURY|nr:hypothetical protein AUR64_16910 [Haloprofundus marisrubri]
MLYKDISLRKFTLFSVVVFCLMIFVRVLVLQILSSPLLADPLWGTSKTLLSFVVVVLVQHSLIALSCALVLAGAYVATFRLLPRVQSAI